MASIPDHTAVVTEWQDYPHYGMSAYRIWVRREFGVWQQRHEWRRADGSIQMDDWIRSFQPSADWLSKTTPAAYDVAA